MQNRNGDFISLQPSFMGLITDLDSANFSPTDKAAFLVKNDGTEAVTLEVKLFGMSDSDDFVETKFQPGWNPEIIKEVKLNATAGLDLKYGY